jgi:hypothetical protein
MASSRDFACRSAKPAINSFDSVNGPSVTTTFSPERRTRAPSALGRHPSVASRTPAFMLSSISFSILAMWSSVGGVFVSTVL